MASGVLVFAEQRDGKLRKVVLELLNIGKQIADKVGGPLSAVIVGKGVGDLAKNLGKFGASKVFVADRRSARALFHRRLCRSGRRGCEGC